MTRSAERRTLRRRALGWLAGLAPWLLRPLLVLLRASLRIEVAGDAALRAHWGRGERVVLALWHQCLLVLPVLTAGQPTCILVSQHRDGDLATGLLDAWGITTVRGSASRGAVGGFLRLVGAYRQGHNVAVLPDGPRGPRQVAKPGVVHLAKVVGAPIVPAAYTAEPAWRLRSWDRMIIPKPFARVRIVAGEPLVVPGDATAEQLAAACAEVEARLVALTASLGSGAAPPAAG